MNILQKALIDGLADDVLEQLQPEIAILTGSIIPLSNFGKSKWDAGVGYTTFSLVANFIQNQDAPFVVTEYGTVQVVEEPRLVFHPIFTESCKVSFNHVFFKKLEAQGNLIDYYTAQLKAKVRAWDEKCASFLMFGNPNIGMAGLLQGSGIPIITSTVNLSVATQDAVINEIVRIATTPANASKNLYRPTLIGMPQDLWNILNQRSYSTTNSETLLEVVVRRLKTAAGYNKVGDPEWQISAVPDFSANKMMTVMSDNPDHVAGCLWDLEEFYSPDNSEAMDVAGNMCASAHEGGVLGVIAKVPLSSVIALLSY